MTSLNDVNNDQLVIEFDKGTNLYVTNIVELKKFLYLKTICK